MYCNVVEEFLDGAKWLQLLCRSGYNKYIVRQNISMLNNVVFNSINYEHIQRKWNLSLVDIGVVTILL